MNRILAFICLLLAALASWQFSSLWVAQEINQQANLKATQLQQGESPFVWSFAENKTEMVGAYRDDWLQRENGVQALKEKSILSLKMPRQFLTLWFEELQLQTVLEGQALMNIEVTNGEPGVFFYAHEIPLQSGTLSLDLNALVWYRTMADQEWEKVQWESIGPVASVVLQFYIQDAVNLQVQQVKLPQTAPILLASRGSISCTAEAVIEPLLPGTYETDCPINNALVSMHHAINLDNPGTSVTTTHASSAYVWLLSIAGLVLFFVALTLLSPSVVKEARIWILLILVSVFLWVIHRPGITVIYEWYDAAGWIFAACSLGLIVWLRHDLLRAFKKQTYRGWFVVLVPTVILLLIFIWHMTLDFDLLFKLLPLYLLWAFLQQILLGPVVSDLVRRRLSISAFEAAVICGLLFSVIHMPNQSLMLATWIAGTFWSWVWLQYRNLLPNVISHAVLALFFYQVMPEFYLHSARIGIRFLG